MVKIIKDGFNRNKENPYDYYPTPPNFSYRFLKIIKSEHYLQQPRNILDPGAARGVWAASAKILWRHSDVYALDIIEEYGNSDIIKRYCKEFICCDFREWETDLTFDLVVGNPPYTVSHGKKDLHLSEKFIDFSYRSLNPGGVLTFLLPTVFIEGSHRGYSLFKNNPPNFIYQSIHRIPFDRTKKGTNSTAYAMYVWIKSDIRSNPIVRWFDYRTGNYW